MNMTATKTLSIVNNRSGWSVVASRTLSGAGRYRDENGRYATAAYEEVRVLDRRIARFSSLPTAIAAVIALVEWHRPDHITFCPPTRACEEAFVQALVNLSTEGIPGISLEIRRSIQESELSETPRTPYAQAWNLARRAWFNDNCETQDSWYRRD